MEKNKVCITVLSSSATMENMLGYRGSHALSATRLRISWPRMIRCRLCLLASSSLGGRGGTHGMLVGTIEALTTRSMTAARTACEFVSASGWFESNG